MLHVAVFGAGAVGCWVGGRLASAGTRVTLIGRPRVMAELADGVRAGELGGTVHEAKPELATTAEAARGADIVLVTVKSAATAEAGRELAGVLGEAAVVASLQNGVRNPRVLREVLPGRRVLAAMIEFNIVRTGPGTYQRMTSGRLMFERSYASAQLEQACRAANLACELRDDMPAVQWAKLVLNLNNAINALSNVPLAAELAQRDYRRVWAAAQREALAALAAAGQPIAKLTPLPAAWIPRVLRLPDSLFLRVAKRFVSVDPRARSSMWDDFEARRRTEVDFLQGEVVELAERVGRGAPVNAAIARLVHDAEAGGRRDYSGRELLQLLR
ncbi:MAG TPA: 2-dehydropantoate 2-reductase [Kofleriaceae bacterium]|jgi:2-dehydropantoate 2-reductase